MHQILNIPITFIAGLLGAAFLLRFYMQYHRISFANPLGQFAIALTNWLVLPLRRVLRAAGRWDLSSLAGAFLIALLKVTLQLLLIKIATTRFAWALLVLAASDVLMLAVSGMMALIVLGAILSWFSGQPELRWMLGQLTAPVLKPLRRIIPPIGGTLDITPMIAIMLLAMLAAAIEHSRVLLLLS